MTRNSISLLMTAVIWHALSLQISLHRMLIISSHPRRLCPERDSIMSDSDHTFVSTPIPGPISITPTPFSAPESSAIRGHTEGLIKKFCPRDFENVKPCLPKISLIVPISDNLFILKSVSLSDIYSLVCRLKLCHTQLSLS